MTNDKSFSPADFNKPDVEAVLEYDKIKLAALSFVNNKMLNHPNLTDIIGHGNRGMMLDNHKNHAEFMDTFFQEFETDVLPETMLWVFKTYRARGFKVEYWNIHLGYWLEALKELMSAHGYEQISPIYIWLIDNIEAAAQQS